MKVKIFERDDKEKLEEDINDFIDRKICTYLKIKKNIDIKYSTERCGYNTYYSAMIIYEEEKD